jgi:hypothetical protein
MRPKYTLAILAFAQVAAAAELVLYEDENFGGRRVRVDAAATNVAEVENGFQALSIVVVSASWQVCDAPRFRGACVMLAAGRYDSLHGMGLTERISSVRPLAGIAKRRDDVRIVLYDGYDFQGRAESILDATSNLSSLDFKERARSAIVYGDSWELCELEQFRGNCAAFAPGGHPNLGFLDGQLSSLRPVGSAPPPANWGTQGRIIIYAGVEFSGAGLVSQCAATCVMPMPRTNFRFSSMRIESGYWMLCSRPDLQGDCVTFGPGEHPNITPVLAPALGSQIASFGRK